MRTTIPSSKPSLVFFLITTLLLIACDQEPPLESRFDSAERVDQLEGVDTGKFDRANTVTKWQLKEDGDYSMIEGLNDLGDRTFAAIIPKDVSSAGTKVTLIGASRCEVTLDPSTMGLEGTTCSDEALKAFEVPAIQLVSTLSPTLSMDELNAMKSDGLFTKIACVGAGIGATMISLMVWHFASGVAAAGASISTTVPILSAGSSVLGAVALCYNAFFDGGKVSGCMSDCGQDQGCFESCVVEAKSEIAALEGIERAELVAANLMQCVGSCDGLEGCESICYELLSSEEMMSRE